MSLVIFEETPEIVCGIIDYHNKNGKITEKQRSVLINFLTDMDISVELKSFSGIGSRETPQDDLYLLRDASKYFCGKGYILRSGAANGSDFWCEKGANMVGGKKEIYLPWRGFNDSESNLFPDNLPKWLEAQKIAKQFHPAWDRLGDAAKKLHSRNGFQILGKNLDNPVDFVLCYCPIVNGEWVGGTSQALRIAKHHRIPIINIFNEEHKKKLIKKIYTK